MGLEYWSCGWKNGREKLNYDTINTDQASGRSHAGGTYEKGGKAFAGFAGEIKSFTFGNVLWMQEETGSFFISYTIDVLRKRNRNFT